MSSLLGVGVRSNNFFEITRPRDMLFVLKYILGRMKSCSKHPHLFVFSRAIISKAHCPKTIENVKGKKFSVIFAGMGLNACQFFIQQVVKGFPGMKGKLSISMNFLAAILDFCGKEKLQISP